MEINRIKIINEVIKLLMSRPHEYLSINTITKYINEDLELDIPSRTIKQYVADIKNQLGYELDNKFGPDGGIKLSKEARKAISEVSLLQLDEDDKNALNDAFEIAEKSGTFYYYKDLQEARKKLYLRFNLKEDDGEYYVGQEQHKPEVTKNIKQIKKAIVDKKALSISFKYVHYGSSLELKEYKPIFIIHDVDESFVVLKPYDSDKEIIQNILNIKEINTLAKSFALTKEYSINDFANKHTLTVKGEHHLKFDLFDTEGHEIFDTWNYEFDDKSKDHNKKHIIFYEEYRVFEFLLRMQAHIKNLDMDESLKIKWNVIIGKLEKI